MSIQTIPPPQTVAETKAIHPNSLDAEVNKYFGMYGNTLMHVSGLSRDLQTAASSSCALIHKNTVLLAHRAQEPQKDKLVIPGGFVEENETLEQAAVREVREEIGVIIDDPSSLQYVTSGGNAYDYNGHRYFTSDAFFTREVAEKPQIIIQKTEIAEAVWVALDGSFDLEEMAFDSHKKAFLAVLAKHFQK